MFLVALSITSAFLAPRIILGDRVVAPKKATALAGQVAQALQTDTSLPRPNGDFSISDAHYFSSDTWCVASVLVKGTDPAFVVLKKVQGVFVAVLGPATSFDGSYVKNLPQDVADYLSSKATVLWN